MHHMSTAVHKIFMKTATLRLVPRAYVKLCTYGNKPTTILWLNNTIRKLCFLVMHALVALGPFSVAKAAILKPYLVTKESTIRLKDVFEGLSQYGDIIIAPAPAPGQKTAYPFTWLKGLARQYQVDWIPQTQKEKLIVERTGRLIGLAEIAPLLKTTARAEGTDPEVELSLDQPGPRVMVSDGGAVPEISIESFTIDPKGERFTATLRITDPGYSTAHHVTTTGRFVRMLSIPVVARDLAVGQIITSTDIIMRSFPSDQIRPQTIRDPEQLIGHNAPFRALKAGESLQLSDIKQPYLIARGTLVTMVIKTQRMVVTAKGKAMDNARKGESVRVMNLDSKKIVSGIAEKENVVKIEPVQGVF